jgi:hypothetical protein
MVMTLDLLRRCGVRGLLALSLFALGSVPPLAAQDATTRPVDVDDDDDTDLGWIGLRGLAGLLGLRKRGPDRDDAVRART